MPRAVRCARVVLVDRALTWQIIRVECKIRSDAAVDAPLNDRSMTEASSIAPIQPTPKAADERPPWLQARQAKNTRLQAEFRQLRADARTEREARFEREEPILSSRVHDRGSEHLDHLAERAIKAASCVPAPSSTQPPRPAKTAFTPPPFVPFTLQPSPPSGPFSFSPRAFNPPRFGEPAAVAPNARMSVPPVERPGYVPTSFAQASGAPSGPFSFNSFNPYARPAAAPSVFVGSGESAPSVPSKPFADSRPSFTLYADPSKPLFHQFAKRKQPSPHAGGVELSKAPQPPTSDTLLVGANKGDADTIARVQTMLDKFMRELDSTLAPSNMRAVASGERIAVQERKAAPAPVKDEDASVKMPGAFVEPPARGSLGVHKGYLCDGCDQEIKGIRYRCQSCHDYDLCSACFGKPGRSRAPHQPHHTVRPIQPPGACGVGSVGPRMRMTGLSRPAPAGPAPPAVHNATCDICSASIIGTRWRCMSCPDWDCCADCYSSVGQLHPIHALVPITDAAVSRKLLRSSEATVPHFGVTCDSCQRPIRGIRFKCTHEACPDFDLVRPCAHPAPS